MFINMEKKMHEKNAHTRETMATLEVVTWSFMVEVGAEWT